MASNYDITPSEITDEELQLIKRHLKKVLASNYFKSAKQLQRFLNFIVEKTISGEGKLLKQYTIGVEALSFPDDFDPESNPAVRIMAGRVRKRLKEYYQEDGLSDELIISMPNGSYTPVFKKKIPNVNSPNEPQGKSRGPKLALLSFSDKTQSDDSNRFLFQLTNNLAKELSHFLFLQLVVSNPYADRNKSYLVESEMKTESRADYVLALYLQQLPNGKYELLYRLTYVDSGEILWSESYEVNDQQPIEEHDQTFSEIIATVADLQQGSLYLHWSRKLLENQRLYSRILSGHSL